jgi:hypothetical protein
VNRDLQKIPKKSYSAPKLQVYGNLNHLTKAVVAGAGGAEAAPGTHKTH